VFEVRVINLCDRDIATMKSRKIKDEDQKHNFFMCSVKPRNKARFFFIYIGFDENFEIIREKYT